MSYRRWQPLSEAYEDSPRRPLTLVILDLALEGGRGLNLLDRVRHADGLASRIDLDLPVIVLSGRVAEACPFIGSAP